MSHIRKQVTVKALYYICWITVSGEKRAFSFLGTTAYNLMGCGPSAQTALYAAQEMEFSMHEVDFGYKNNNCITTKSCNFYIK